MPAPNEDYISCPNEKSPDTPCVARDGALAECLIHGRAACVGCEQGVSDLFRDIVRRYVDLAAAARAVLPPVR